MAGRFIPGYRAQTRSRIICYTVVISLLLLGLAVLQTSFFTKVTFFGAVPDLLICTVLIIACTTGQYAGAISGIAAGFLADALGSVGISVLPLVYFLFGYIAGCYAKYVSHGTFQGYLLCFAAALVTRALTTSVLAFLDFSTVSVGQMLLRTVLPEMGGTALAGMILFYPLARLMGWLNKKN